MPSAWGKLQRPLASRHPRSTTTLPANRPFLMPLWRALLPITKKTRVKFPSMCRMSNRTLHCSPNISEDALVEKVRQIFFYSLHDHTVSQFRQMMTLEQFRSPELAELYSRRYVDRMIDYHADIFRTLISLGILRAEDPDTLAPSIRPPGLFTLLSVCDRQPEREAECLEKLDAHVRLFFRTFNIKRGEP